MGGLYKIKKIVGNTTVFTRQIRQYFCFLAGSTVFRTLNPFVGMVLSAGVYVDLSIGDFTILRKPLERIKHK